MNNLNKIQSFYLKKSIFIRILYIQYKLITDEMNINLILRAIAQLTEMLRQFDSSQLTMLISEMKEDIKLAKADEESATTTEQIQTKEKIVGILEVISTLKQKIETFKQYQQDGK